jgi:HPt (histidine-containing phosphotransfer) domain-containing protein
MNYNSTYDITGFANDLGLSFSEISELYIELINEINSSLSELKILMTEKNLKEIQKIIHNIKGVSGNCKLTDVYKKASEINDSLRSDCFMSLESDLNDLFIISSIAERKIKNFFEEKSVLI